MDTETKLKRIAWLSERDHEKIFECLMHHIDYDHLKDNFNRLDPKKAVEIDGVTKQEYGKNLEVNLNALVDKMKRMAYIPLPVKEVLIPKDGQPGKFRPLGISVLENLLLKIERPHPILRSVLQQ